MVWQVECVRFQRCCGYVGFVFDEVFSCSDTHRRTEVSADKEMCAL